MGWFKPMVTKVEKKTQAITYYDLDETVAKVKKYEEDLVKKSQTATTGGRKFDGGKLQYGLVPPLALKATVEILTFGAEKYEPDNWKHVPDSKRRYFDAMQRHLWAWKEGEQNDPETGKNHLAHAMCCLMFLYEHDVKYSIDK
jgi:Domain of unknown function (DUF5664)